MFSTIIGNYVLSVCTPDWYYGQLPQASHRRLCCMLLSLTFLLQGFTRANTANACYWTTVEGLVISLPVAIVLSTITALSNFNFFPSL
jgi:hypothetical protein